MLASDWYLPDHHGVHENTHAEGIVGQEPDGVVGADQELEHDGHIDKVAEVQHEQLRPLRHILKIPSNILSHDVCCKP